MEKKTERIELCGTVLYGGEYHHAGEILDVPIKDVQHFLEKKVGKCADEPPAPIRPSDEGKPSGSTGAAGNSEDNSGDGEGDDEDTILADLQTLPGVTEEIAHAFIAAGVTAKADLAQYTVDELTTVEGVTSGVAEGILAALKEPPAPKAKAPKKPGKGKKAG